MRETAFAACAVMALALSALVAPALAAAREPLLPGLPELPHQHGREGNNTTGNGTDTTPPAIAITSHHDRETLKESKITLRGTASDAGGLLAVEVSVNRGAWTPAAEPSAWAVPIRLAEGRNTVSARATDLAGNVAYQNISIVVDNSVRDNTGILLAAAVIIPVAAVIVLFTTRRKPAPAGETPENHSKLEKELGLEGKKRDDTGAELEDSEEVTRLDKAPVKRTGKPGRR